MNLARSGTDVCRTLASKSVSRLHCLLILQAQTYFFSIKIRWESKRDADVYIRPVHVSPKLGIIATPDLWLCKLWSFYFMLQCYIHINHRRSFVPCQILPHLKISLDLTIDTSVIRQMYDVKSVSYKIV